MSLEIGSRLGLYEIVGLLGSGGMGQVYRARDPRLGRDIALKVIPDDFAQDPERLLRFEREARTVAALNHPGIVTLHSIEVDGSTRFLTMEVVEGRTLDRVAPPGGLPGDRLFDIVVGLTDALAFAHDRGIMHGDLKPANVMLTGDGRVKILDFGLARRTRPAPVAGEAGAPATDDLTRITLLTQPGLIVGTPAYMAPEQLRGETIDARSDVFALGVIFFELAAGWHPFARPSLVDVTSAITRDPPPRLQDVRPDLAPPIADAVARCLEKNPGHRFQSARELLETLKGDAAPVSRTRQETPSAPYSSIAVLPFVNHSASDEDEYFSDGLADQLINLLSKVTGLRVAARTTAFQFKNRKASIAEIGATLRVGAVLEGSVRKAGDRVRASVQLVSVKDGYSIWSETFDRRMDDIFAVQDHIAEKVVSEIRARLTGVITNPLADGRGEIERAAVGRGSNAEAHRLVLLSRHLLARYTREDTARARENLERALELDAENAAAWVEISRAWSREAHFGWSPVTEGSARGREAAEMALAIAPELPEAHAELGRIQTNFDWDWSGAEASLRRALELGPGIAVVHQLAGSLAYLLGRLDDAIAHCRQAAELDVLSAPAHHTLGSALRAADRLSDAEASYRRALELSPKKVGVHADLALAMLASGRGAEAIEEAGLESLPALRDWALAIIHAELGQIPESNALLQRLIGENAAECAYQIAEVCAVLGDFSATRQWLERAYSQQDSGLMETNVSPRLRLFRKDPLGLEFLQRMKFDGITLTQS